MDIRRNITTDLRSMCKGRTREKPEMVTYVLIQEYQRIIYLQSIHQKNEEMAEEDPTGVFETDEFKALSEDEQEEIYHVVD